MKKILAVSFLLFVAIVVFAGWQVHSFFTMPGPALTHPVIVFVPAGTTLRATARILAAEGVLSNAPLFIWWARWTGEDRKIKNGEYVFTNSLSPLTLLRILTGGRGMRHAITIPEGMTFHQIAGLLAAQGLGAEESFLCLTTEPRFLARWGLPPQGLEGYVYPDTYHFSWLASPEEILGHLVARLYTALSPELYRRAATLGLSMHEVLTLASLIEKETAVAEERTLVSAVFHNRLRKRMPLQCDPTVIYGLARLGQFDGNLTRQHLRTPTAYNTYLLPGLPPGPIASPGIESIRAALHPAENSYLYFVARGDGTHVFSSNLADHNRAVQYFQKRQS
jgi:UPF0755 protein